MATEQRLSRASKRRTLSGRTTLAAFSALLVITIAAGSPALAQPPDSSVAGQPAATNPLPAALSPAETQAMVHHVLQAEIEAAQDTGHPMQYQLRKSSPRYATTKEIIETKDGDVAYLLAINNGKLSELDQQNEDARLNKLLDDPSLQRHRQEREQGDTDRARKVMRALPDAFLYTYAGLVDTPQGPSYRMTYQPNPKFDPEDLEAQVLKGMAGEMWIDVAQQRVTHLDGKRLHDVDYGWGILGKLDQGGTLLLEQADVGNHQWRTVHMVLVMNARVLLKTVKLDTTLELSQFKPVASGMSYQQAIHMLRAAPAGEK
jgi:hypothetical protein